MREFFVVLCLVCIIGSILSEEPPAASERIYDMKKCSGAGCPYTASWLGHVNLYRKLTWYLDSTKMEAASFVIFDKAKLKFQMSDPDSYFVHHMSMYEHLNHKKYGYEIAANKTLKLSNAAFNGECGTLKVSKSKEYMALIPFYGGRPPGVNTELKVGSIGEGNSLVPASTKALQALATICSCLKYFGHVTVGVARLEDKHLMNEMLSQLSVQARHHVNVIMLKMNRPSHLPFHLLNWGQHYVKRHNCQQFYYSTLRQTNSSNNSTVSSDKLGHLRLAIGKKLDELDEVDTSAIPVNREEYEICFPNAIAKAVGNPVNVTYSKKNEATFMHSNSSSAKHKTPFVPIKYVYYSECDQVVRFDDDMTLLALTAASNDTTFFTGRRREKAVDSDPEAYMGNLDNWRNCGIPGYSLHWPRDIHVQFSQ